MENEYGYEDENETGIEGGLGALNASGDLMSEAEALADYRARQKSFDENRANYQQIFSDALSRLREQRVGPTTAERLFAISAALQKPTRTGSIFEELGNLSGVLGAQEKTAREAEMERATLLEKYGLAQGAASMQAMKAQLDAAKDVYTRTMTAQAARERAVAAQARAGRPSFQLDATGQIREVPKTVHRPTTREDYAAIPAGEYYVVPSGPNAGKVILKQAGEGF
jgi:hypothetical protein